MTDNSLAIEILKVSNDDSSARADFVAVEEPLEIQLSASNADNAAAKSLSITMRTPGNDIELALGFLISEGIISRYDQVQDARHTGEPAEGADYSNVIRIELQADLEVDFESLQRHFYTTSSCGVCGKSSIDALRVTGLASLKDKGATYNRNMLLGLPAKLLEQQRIFTQTGGLHAAAVFDPEGKILLVREDVGRHNAVDKVVGALLMQDAIPANELGLLVSGRASFELVQKALVAGLPTMLAVSAPSSLAVELANDFDMTLVGFLRDNNFNIYSGDRRIS